MPDHTVLLSAYCIHFQGHRWPKTAACPVTVLEDRVQKLVLLQGRLFPGLLPTSGSCPQLLVFLGSSSVAPSLPPVSHVTCLLPDKVASRWVSVLLLCTCSLLSLMVISESLLPSKATCTGSGWTWGDTLQSNIFGFFFPYIVIPRLVHVREWFSNPVTTKQRSVKAPKLIV